MPQPDISYIAQTIGELNDELGWMVLHAPKFTDDTGYFPEQNLDSVFRGLNDSIDHLLPTLGQERHDALRILSDRMRVFFETDPENIDSRKAGRQIIHQMELMLRRKRAAPK